jgi:hypothetical protein
MTPPLSLARFGALLEAYGARLELWPEAERDAARALLETSLEARELRAAEAALDAAFESAPEPELSAALMRRLNEVPIRTPQRRALWPFRSVWVPALGWALAAAVGLGIGFQTAPFESDTATFAESATSDNAASGDEPAADDDFMALASGSLAELEANP